MHDETGDDEAGVPEHHREQPHDPRRIGLVGENRDEARKFELRLMPWRRLEP